MDAVAHIFDDAVAKGPAALSNVKTYKNKNGGSVAAHAAADALGIKRAWGQIHTLTATHCVACGARLRDAVSVTRGMGPICSRKHYDLPVEITPTMMQNALGILHASNLASDVKLAAKRLKGKPRDLLNILVWWSATHLDKADTVIAVAEIATALGFGSLGNRLRERNTDVVVSRTNTGSYIVRCRSKMSMRRRMARLMRADSRVQAVPKKGRFKFGWDVPAKRMGIVWTILGLDFGGGFATVPQDLHLGGTTVKAITTTTWRDLRDVFTKAFPPTVKRVPPATKKPGSEIVQVVPGNPPTLRVYTPGYNQGFVADLKELPVRHRKWDPHQGCWWVSAQHEGTVRALVSKHFGKGV